MPRKAKLLYTRPYVVCLRITISIKWNTTIVWTPKQIGLLEVILNN